MVVRSGIIAMHGQFVLLLDIAYCDQEISEGFLWPRTLNENTVSRPCNLASDSFRRETRAFRQCLRDGTWSDPDLTTCTLRDSVQPFLLLWFSIDSNMTNQTAGPLSPGIGIGFDIDGNLDRATRFMFEMEVRSYV